MKVSTHPLMVAVAMGLLGPAVLTDDEHEEVAAPQEHVSVEAEVVSALDDVASPVWAQLRVDPQ